MLQPYDRPYEKRKIKEKKGTMGRKRRPRHRIRYNDKEHEVHVFGHLKRGMFVQRFEFVVFAVDGKFLFGKENVHWNSRFSLLIIPRIGNMRLRNDHGNK